MTDTLLSLAERCERAGASEQGRMLMLAREALAAAKLLDYGAQARCLKFCEAEAYESAALTLLPVAEAGYSAVFWRLGNDGEGGNPEDFKAEVLNCAMLTSQRFLAVAVTPALALCAAALRSRASTEGQTDG